MFLQGWIIGWMIQLAVALLLWLPLALFSGGAGSWDRAWAIGAKVRTGFWLLLLLFIGGALLVGQVQQGVPAGTNQRASTASDAYGSQSGRGGERLRRQGRRHHQRSPLRPGHG